MLLIPAIDIKNGKCVRLRQGDMGEETVYNSDPGRNGDTMGPNRRKKAAYHRS